MFRSNQRKQNTFRLNIRNFNPLTSIYLTMKTRTNNRTHNTKPLPEKGFVGQERMLSFVNSGVLVLLLQDG